MRSKKGAVSKKASGLRRYFSVALIILNVVLLSSAFLLYALYTDAYDERLHKENLGNIANLNHSAAVNAASLFNSWKIKLDDVAKYAEIHDLTHDEFLKVLNDTNSSDERYFELIGSDYTGYLARSDDNGTFPALDYRDNSYTELQKIFGNNSSDASEEIKFTPEFTDGGKSALKFFAIYKHVTLKNGDGKQLYTLLLATESSAVLKILNDQADYEGQSTVLIDEAGNYIVSNYDFKSSNFFQYLYKYNDLTLDQKIAVRKEMEANVSGELYYMNASSVVENCVFRYEKTSANGGYCITCVPISSFHVPAFNINYIIYAVVILLILFALDVVWLQGMNRRLRISMLREKEASAAKGNFMSRMSHEIRTPLNAIIGYNIIARDEIKNAGNDEELMHVEMKVMDCLTKSEIASKHLLTIINDVLDMSAIESGKINVAHEKFDFKGLITSLSTIFYSQARAKGVEFEVIFDTLTEEWFIGDQMRTGQILTNLLTNAVKFTPEGGNVSLKINQPEADTNASHIHFSISDTGIGMSPEYLNHIWTPFEQADSSISRRFGGTGLGLAITKNLIDLMGGTITVESTPGVGTKFNVDLTFERAEQPASNPAYDFSKVNALVVDDDISTCDYIKLLFNRCGARCVSVTSGIEAINAVNASMKNNEQYTVCLIDWRMPQMDGIETIRGIRKIAGDDIPIIVLTAYDYSELADKAAEIGVSRFISKPLFQSSLFDLLANICGTKPTAPIEKNESFDFTGSRVLLAEDNVMNMEIAKTIMESTGLLVDSAWNGREAVEMFEKSASGTYTAILMDVHMPEMNGHEAARAIRASAHVEATTIPIIAMTADAFAENVAEAHESGMNDHISKPIDMTKLFSTLKKYI